MAMAGWKTSDMLSGIEGIMNLAAASGEDSLSTSLSCDCVVRISPFTPFNAAVSFVVSPPISTVMPCILDGEPPSPKA